MPDYQLAKIYRLTCNNPDLVYYGATTRKYLCHRLSGHKNQWIHKKSCTKSALLFEAGNVKIELLENFPCNDKNELNAREAHYIRNNNCVNKCIPGRTHKEYREENKERKKEFDKKYYEENKERRKEFNKKYYEENKERKKEYWEKNKEKINNERKEKIPCPCGATVSKRNISNHKKSKKHKTWEESQT